MLKWMPLWRQVEYKSPKTYSKRGWADRRRQKERRWGDSCCYVRTSCKLWPFHAAAQCCHGTISWALWTSQGLPHVIMRYLGFYLSCVNTGCVPTVCECAAQTASHDFNDAIVVTSVSIPSPQLIFRLCLFEMPCSPCPGSMVIKFSVSNYTELSPERAD